jgi:hypothetical protein
MVADAADGADGVCRIGSLTHAIIVIIRKTISMPSVGTKICARHSRPASAQGLAAKHASRSTGKVTCIAEHHAAIRSPQCGDPGALRLAFKDLVGSAFLRQHRPQRLHN